ncbi:hypothetical protein [Thiobacillus denitrificans]|uniref:Uncharacterized protein n=1 Tax=Thiobacillus denitrificans TaxID=36861 RepID=A0A125BCG9_THIDE|nr:hypothetical protein [Thiobacillus denitrificans]KVW95479.1 hypothetical protein ABW22_09905 [Thiobacillus denitrificans]
MVVSLVRLAAMFFRPDIAICYIQRAIEAPEFACVDPAICAEMLFHGANVVLLLHQFAEFGAGQLACTRADLDPLPLPILAALICWLYALVCW